MSPTPPADFHLLTGHPALSVRRHGEHVFGKIANVDSADDDLEDPTGIDAWEAIVRAALLPCQRRSKKSCDEFIAQIRQPLAPGDPRNHHLIARFFLRRFAG